MIGARRRSEVMRYELRMRTIKGREIRTAHTAFRHLDESGNPVFDGALEDITGRREREANSRIWPTSATPGRCYRQGQSGATATGNHCPHS